MQRPQMPQDATMTSQSAGGELTITERRRQFGDRLKTLREAHGLSVGSLAQTTRIGRTFIEALELGAFERLPGAMFGRGFVRCLTKNLGPDALAQADELLNEFGALWADDVSRPPSDVQINRRLPPSLFRRLTTILAGGPMHRRSRAGVLAGVAIAAAGIGLVAKSRSTISDRVIGHFKHLPRQAAPTASGLHTDTQSAKAPAQAAAAGDRGSAAPLADLLSPADGAPAPKVGNDGTGSTATPAQKAPEPIATAEPQPPRTEPPKESTKGQQVLELTVSQPVRVRLDLDHGESEIRRLTPDTYKFAFSDHANMMVYDAGAVKISFNGRPLGPLGSKGRVRRLSFEAKAPSEASGKKL